ncbi:hypothetical protein [Kibdelosporangium phytohabitans]|uniref:hypothetical protein n=1 Tax=Kibdelosporangium phytohabitans TaxID=860235 RepID=UPI0007C83B84|nr:hypothetical protein [Kibdelosporangium phytohabitans]MBE1469579.1 hypothetical protein [Kibdelosporangium phytohabitans]
MLQTTVRGNELHPVRVDSGERLVFGRDPHGDPPRPGRVALRLPGCAPHVSGVLAELVVGREAAMLRWLGAGEGRLSSLLDAPGGARRVTLVRGMSAMLDLGKNELVVLAGRQVGHDLYTDLPLTFAVTAREASAAESITPGRDTEHKPHIRKGQLARYSKEWYVALALAEPWLAGNDDSPFPPTNRLIYERIRDWRAGNAWNLDRPQRVDDAIRAISRVVFGELADPYSEARDGRIQNPRFAIGKRIAEYRLVTADDLAEVHTTRPGP